MIDCILSFMIYKYHYILDNFNRFMEQEANRIIQNNSIEDLSEGLRAFLQSSDKDALGAILHGIQNNRVEDMAAALGPLLQNMG